MSLRFVAVIVLLGWSVCSFASDWGQVGETEHPVNLEADELTYDKDTGRYHAAGNVHLTQGEMEVHSRILWWDQVSGEIEAEGDVKLTSPEEQLSGDKVQYNLQAGTGVVEGGKVFLREDNLHVSGRQIERRGQFDYRVIDGTFTTCDGEVPSWKFGAEQLDVTLDGYARGKHATFYLKDIPSFYLPYIVYPVKTERESGLLIPSIGYSEKRGFQYNGAYYQVLGRNQDATLYVDYLSDMGIGKGLEYRYVFGQDNAGEAQIYHIDVDQVDGVSINEDRYALEWQHDGELPGGVRMVADALFVNEDDYFEDFGEVAEEYNKDKVQSVFSLSKNWGKYNLVGQLKYTKDLETDDPTTLQLLPRVSFDATRQRIGETDLFYELEAEYTNFWRDQGIRGERLMLRPNLSASLQLFDVIDVTPEIAYRDRHYWGISEGESSRNEGIIEFSTKVATKLQRVYDQPIGPVDKLRHTLEPEVTYFNIPELDQSHLPSFDSYDRIAEKNQFEYALVQRFTARFEQDGGEALYRELIYLRLSQRYDLRQEAEDNRFSEIRGELTLLPTDWAKFDIDSTFDIDQGEWSEIAVDADIHDDEDNMVSLKYRNARDQDLNYGSVEVTLAWFDPFYINYEKRYDFFENEHLEDVLGVEYRQQCWSAFITFRENDTDRSVLLSFTMKGIGPVGGLSGSLLDR